VGVVAADSSFEGVSERFHFLYDESQSECNEIGGRTNTVSMEVGERSVVGGIPSKTCCEGQRVVVATAVEMISQGVRWKT